MKRTLIPLLIYLLLTGFKAGDEFCGVRNYSFQQGESVMFTVFYAVAGVYINAGTAQFTTTLEHFNNQPVYHVVATGSSNSGYDWIFKVRDSYESYFDTTHLQPLKFIRNIQEGGYKKHENVSFNKAAGTAITGEGVFKVPECIQDVISSMYYARNIDFAKYQVGDKIAFNLFLDNKVYNVYIRYMGKDKIKTKYGKFNAIKIKPLLLEGTLFKGGEKMTIWVSDDANHIPLRIESAIAVGSIKVDMMQYRNLRHPLSSMLSFR